MAKVGTLAAVNRFPVKSMQGEELEAAVITERGIVGDRAYALVDNETGKVASAKHPRKWGRLLECRAAYAEPPELDQPLPPVVITLPDGTRTRSDDADVDAVLSDFIGREITLTTGAADGLKYEAWWPDIPGIVPQDHVDETRIETPESDDVITDEGVALVTPPGTYVDVSALHVITSGTIAEIGRLLPEGTVDVRRFRPNFLVRTDDTGFLENDWGGRSLEIGSVVATVIVPAPRCVMTTLAQQGVEQDRGVLQALAKHNRVELPGLGTWACAGVYAAVSEAGEARLGDVVEIN